MSQPPTPNPVFNPADFTTETGFTEAQANALFPRMATESTCSAKQNFLSGIEVSDLASSVILNLGSDSSVVNLKGSFHLNGAAGLATQVFTSNGAGTPPSWMPAGIDGTTPTLPISILPLQTTGAVTICPIMNSATTLQLGSGSSTVRAGQIVFNGNYIDNVSLSTGNINYSGQCTEGLTNFAVNQTTGNLNIGSNAARSGAINIGTGASATQTMSIYSGATAGGWLNLATGVSSSTVVSVANGASSNGALNIGAAGRVLTLKGSTSSNIDILGGTVKCSRVDVTGVKLTLGASATTGVDICSAGKATAVLGTLSSVGITSTGTLTVSGAGATQLGGALGVTGLSTLAGVGAGALSATSLTSTGALTVSGTGITTLGGALGVSGTSTLAGVGAGALSATSLTSTGALTVSGAGATQLGGALGVTGLLSANGGLSLGGATNLTLGDGTVLPTIGQIGYTIVGAATVPTFSSGTGTNCNSLTVTPGVWIIGFDLSFSVSVAGTISQSIVGVGTNAGTGAASYLYACTANGASQTDTTVYNSPTYSGTFVYSLQAGTQLFRLNFLIAYATSVLSIRYNRMYATRIA